MTHKEITIPFSGFYESLHSNAFDCWIEQERDYMENELLTNSFDLDKFDTITGDFEYSKLYKEYAKKYVEGLQGILQDATGNKKLRLYFKAMESPKYYNYSTDRIFATLAPSHIKKIHAATNKTALNKTIKEQYTSCDGFISHYPDNYFAWDDDVLQWDCNQLGTLLKVYLEQEYFVNEFDEMDVMESFNCNGGMQELIYKFHGNELNAIYPD